jgi:hypothetical protein
VYIQGYCFGDSQGNGSIKLNGELMTDIVFWTDAEIAFRPLLDAVSGNLVVASSSYGSDSTALEANCAYSEPPGWTADYCGNDKINATFSIAPVGPPVYTAAVRNMTAWAPEYVQGMWYYDDGGQTMTLTLNQGPFNTTNGAWVSDYQNYYGPMGQTCAINTPQDLYIDTRTGSAWVPWITDTQMPAEITPTDLIVGLAPGQGELVTACEPYPKLKGKCR